MPPHAAPDKEKVGMRRGEYRSKIYKFRVTKFFTMCQIKNIRLLKKKINSRRINRKLSPQQL